MLKDLYHWTLSLALLPQAGLALFLLSFAESSFFPLPPDLVLIPMCLAEPKLAFFYAGICTAGSVLGGIFGFAVGRYGGRPILKKLFHEDKINWVEGVYKKYDAMAIGIAGFSPIPYKVFTLAAGAFKIDLKTLIVVSIFARGGRFFLIAALIYFFGEPIKAFIDEYFNVLSLVFAVLLVGGFVAIKIFARRQSSGHST